MAAALPDSPAGRAFVWPVRVYWEDTDAGGIVYYANYISLQQELEIEH